MAASSGWCAALNGHPISKVLREINEEDHHRTTRTESRGLIVVQGTDLFVWDSQNACCLHTNLRHVLSDDSGSGDASEKSKRRSFQTLLCTNTPSFAVERLQFSPSGCHMVLSGSDGVSVLELPGRWGKYAEFEGGKEFVSCKTVSIGERLFSRNKKTKVLKVDWHPGSATSSHVTFLTSDNTLSTYNIFQPEQPVEIIPLCQEDAGQNLSGLVSRFEIALGEIAVSFDFGQPRQMRRKKETVWAVFILRGTGDVFLAYSNPLLYSTRSPRSKFRVQGPLTMHPPAEDNYGADACSILCLHVSFTVLVIATCSGKLHLCLVLPSNGDTDGSQSELSWPEDMSLLGEPADLSMFVYESVEIELSLTTLSLETDEVIYDDFNCPVRLERDPGSSDRFHCSHSAGVHTVALPWIHNLINVCSNGDSDEPSAPKECIVEHLVCTTPLVNSPPTPVSGITVVTDHTLGPALLVLTDEIEFIALPLSTKYRSATPPLLSGGHVTTAVSPLRKLSKEPFEDRIRALLKRQTSNPLLKSSSQSELSPQECFQLLTRSTQIFREEYIQKQDLVREEIEKRSNILRRQKEQQLQDLRSLEKTRILMKDTAESLAEKYEEAQDKQCSILTRIESVTKKFQSRLPVLSDAERSMHKDLRKMQENLKNLQTQIEQIQVKRQYQQRQISQSKPTKSSPFLKTNQSTQLKAVLQKQNEEISGLMKGIGQLKLDIGM